MLGALGLLVLWVIAVAAMRRTADVLNSARSAILSAAFRCPGCGAELTFFQGIRLAAKIRIHTAGPGYTLAVCEGCGAVSLLQDLEPGFRFVGAYETEGIRQSVERYLADARRCRQLQSERVGRGLCSLCGKPIGWFSRLLRRTTHPRCTEFVE